MKGKDFGDRYNRFEDFRNLIIKFRENHSGYEVYLEGNHDDSITITYPKHRIACVEYHDGLTYIEENCAFLHIWRNDLGKLFVTLHPCSSKYQKTKEKYIIVCNKETTPSHQVQSVFLKKLLIFLDAYYNCTSIDGSTNIIKKGIVSWLRFTRHQVIDETIQPTRIKTLIIKFVQWVITIGFSGILVNLLKDNCNK